MSAPDFTKLDGMLLKMIGVRRRTFTELCCREVMLVAETLGKRIGDGDRVVDRRLQALRKAGKIKFVRGPGAGWEVA